MVNAEGTDIKDDIPLLAGWFHSSPGVSDLVITWTIRLSLNRVLRLQIITW
jgi:hypothetical protein